MEHLRDKIKELKDRFDSSLSNMLEIEKENAHCLPLRIFHLHKKLNELSGEVNRVIQDSIKS